MNRSADGAPQVRLAPAKLNLTLAVVGRRPDGYHALHSVMVPLDLADRLSVAPAIGDRDTLHVDGLDSGPLETNLVLRAFAATRAALPAGAAPGPLSARLEKRIPVAAGLGGGSSDAAAAIDAALAAWGVELEPARTLAVAAAVGSDVPFFLARGAALVEGRGERVTPLAGVTGRPPAVVLVAPRVPVATAAVFAAYAAGGPGAAPAPGATRSSSEHLAAELRVGLRARDLVARAGVLAAANDLAAAAAVVAPWLPGLRRSLVRLLRRPVGLSGSGPTCWALYPSREEAEAAAAVLQAAVASGDLASPGTAVPFIGASTIVSREPGGKDS
jgi:4-diphosphocytidyl-2-C-methyl-D-erythritol kinase